MSCITIYKHICYSAPNPLEEGEFFALTPWDEEDHTRRGEDDGGKEYLLPSNYQAVETESGELVLTDAQGNRCDLDSYVGRPMLLDQKTRRAYLLERDKKIIRMRTKAGLTRSELAEALGMEQALLYQWENYEVEPTVKQYAQMAKLLNCDILDLI